MSGAQAGTGTDTARLDDVRIARVHLRLGELTLARAELEDLLRRAALDTSGLAALAEARWRTGDGTAAAEAAVAHLDAGGSDDVALCIAAEAAALDGRADEARDLMERLPASDAATLDSIFAGLPRRAPWPSGPQPHDVDDPRGVGRGAAAPLRATSAPNATGLPPAEPRFGIQQPPPSPAALRPAPRPSPRRIKAQLEPLAELARAKAELDTRPDRAFLRLALVLRHDPTLAPAVLDVLHLRREATAALLRGDAQRLLGRHLEAEAAFDAAAETLEAS